jgi:hypothetical protein
MRFLTSVYITRPIVRIARLLSGQSKFRPTKECRLLGRRVPHAAAQGLVRDMLSRAANRCHQQVNFSCASVNETASGVCMKHANIGAAYRSANVTSPPIKNSRLSDSRSNSDRHTAARGSAAAIFRSSANRPARAETTRSTYISQTSVRYA